MAFVAGILLMYMPEQPAFRVFCSLMAPEGPNLRRFYLPGAPLPVPLRPCVHTTPLAHDPALCCSHHSRRARSRQLRALLGALQHCSPISAPQHPLCFR